VDRDTFGNAVGCTPDGAGYVRAMTVAVVPVLPIADEIRGDGSTAAANTTDATDAPVPEADEKALSEAFNGL